MANFSNKTDDSIITGSASGDNIYNYGARATINAAAGNDSIYNVGSYNVGSASTDMETLSDGYSAIINGDAGNDYINNSAPLVTINGGNGNDTIVNYGTGKSIDALSSQYLSINGGAGDDIIFTNGNYTSGMSMFVWVNGDEGNDTIVSDDMWVSSLEGGKGDDLISLSGTYNGSTVIYNNGDGDDTIDYRYTYDGVEYVGTAKLVITGEKYTTIQSGNDLKINVGKGSILLKDAASVGVDIIGTLSIDGEYIDNSKSNTIINGTSKDDSITNTGSNVTILGGEGNDTIDVYTEYIYTGTVAVDLGISVKPVSNVSINSGAGNDYVDIYDRSAWMLNSAEPSVKSVTVDAGAGNDTITNIVANATIDAGSGEDSINNTSGSYVLMNGGSGNDTITNYGVQTTDIYGTTAHTGIKNTIDGGDGDDYIVNGSTDYGLVLGNAGDSISINGGSGNDTIIMKDFFNAEENILGGYNGTAKGGKGNDLISISADSKYNVIQYASGDGNDTVYGFNADETLQIAAASYTTTKSGNDVKVNVGSGSILLKDAANTDLNIVTVEGGSSEDTTPADTTPADTLPAGISVKNDVLTASSKFTDTEIKLSDYEDVKNVNAAAVTQGVIIVGNDSDNSIKSGKGADTISGGKGDDTVSLGGGNDVYIYSGGNDLIQDYKAGEDKIKLSSGSISSASLNGGDVVLKVGTGSIKIKDAKDKNITVIDSSGKETSQIYPEVSPTVPADTLPVGITVKKDVLTASNKFTGTEINLEDYEAVKKANAAALSQGVIIVGNDSDNSIKAGKGADTISGGNGNDTLTGGAGKDVFVYTSGNDLITDYKVGEDKINLDLADVTKSSVKGSDVILTTDEGTLKIKGMKDKVVTFIDASGATADKIFFAGTSYSPLETGLKYDAKRTVLTASNKYTGTEIDLGDYLSSVTKVNASATKQALNIVGNDNNNSIKGSKFADTISGGNGKNTLTGGAGNDLIIGGKGDDKILGEAGNDTLNGGKGKNTLTGGAGADTFVYDGGNDLITDYKVGEDRISLNLADVTKSSVKGSDVILTTAEGTLTIKGAKDKVVTFIDASGATTERIFFADTYYTPLEDGLKYDAKRTVLTASNKFKGSEIDLGDYLSSVTKVNASAVSQGVNIVGNSNNNSIKAGKGADTIGGGSGNDTLTGGAGKDVFVYTGGNDIITDYKLGEDKIEIEGKISNTSYKGKDVIFTIGSGTLTVKGMKGKEIQVTDSSGTQIYSKTFDLICDNNFVTDEFGIDEISEQKFEVTQIQNSNTETFAQDDNSLITFTDK